ncbi:MAG: GTP pyrophosphokinase [Cellvibrionaceae bacterium]|jgi:GTP pyrophosphokinase
MVKIRHYYSSNSPQNIDINKWASRIIEVAKLPESSYELLVGLAEKIQKAEQEAIASDNIWSAHASSFISGLEMADILADLHLDQDAIIAATVYRSVRENKLSIIEVTTLFGENVANIVNGVLRMADIRLLRNDTNNDVFGKESEQQLEKVRKMLISMVDDVRIAIIKLAERTCAIRAVKNGTETSKRKVAKEVSDIYAPLAHRLGIGHIKWELEDLAFRYLRPDEYKNIAGLLAEKRMARQDYIEKIVAALNTQIKKNDLAAEVYGRVKHIYSIWLKMQRKKISFSEVYDIRAVRIMVDNTRDCYELLSIVHTMWRNIPHEFDDYIAAPKKNGYRSLHTAVVGPENKVLEVQIRSREMHEEAEYGVCSHWRYKGIDSDSSHNNDSYEQKIEWLRQVLDWHEHLSVSPLSDDVSRKIVQNRIYVFTPEGHIVDLPKNSTPLDFAYRVHTAIGHRCRGAKVNGRIVQLNYKLKTSDQVEVLTGKDERPSRNWLIESLGYLYSARARSKVRHWFGAQAREQNITDGHSVFDKELRRLGLNEINFTELVNLLKHKNLNELYASIGSGVISVTQVINAVQKLIAPVNEPHVHIAKKVSDNKGADIYIEGVGNLMTTIASCCNPVPGDYISGYITQGRGVSIHRMDCRNFLQLQSDESERILEVSWGQTPHDKYSVDIIIEAYDRIGLLRDVTMLLDGSHINVTAMQTNSNHELNTVDMVMTIEIEDFTQLSRILAKINQLPNIASAQRRQS